MGELWRDLVEVLRKRPVLWLPVLIADLLVYLVNFGRALLLHSLVLHQTAQQSVFGGAVVHGPMTGSVAESTTVFALLLSWVVNFLKILLYTAAFAVTAALVQAVLERRRKIAPVIGPALTQGWGGILELTLRALAVYAIAALLFSWLAPVLLKHGQTALVRGPWFPICSSLLVLLVLATTLPAPALRLLSGRAPLADEIRLAQQFCLILALVTEVLTIMVASNSRELAGVPPGARFPLEIVGSLVVALPYVLIFAGMAVMARRLSPGDPEIEG